MLKDYGMHIQFNETAVRERAGSGMTAPQAVVGIRSHAHVHDGRKPIGALVADMVAGNCGRCAGL